MNVDSNSLNTISSAKTIEDKSNIQTSTSSVVAIPINAKENSGTKSKIGVNVNPKIVSNNSDLKSTIVSSNGNSSSNKSSNLNETSDSNQQRQLVNRSIPASNVRIVRQQTIQNRIPTTDVGNNSSVNIPNSSINKNLSELNGKIENTIEGNKNSLNSNTVNKRMKSNRNSNTVKSSAISKQNDSNTHVDVLKSIIERLDKIELNLKTLKQNEK
jgi:hypothetical protein